MDYMRGEEGGGRGEGDRVLITLYEMIETREEELGLHPPLAYTEEKQTGFRESGVFFATCFNIVYTFLLPYLSVQNTDNLLFP